MRALKTLDRTFGARTEIAIGFNGNPLGTQQILHGPNKRQIVDFTMSLFVFVNSVKPAIHIFPIRFIYLCRENCHAVAVSLRVRQANTP